MRISNISQFAKPNFGRMDLKDVTIFEDARLNRKDKQQIKDLAWALNYDVAKDIAVYAEVGRPEATNYEKAIRVITAPLERQFNMLRLMRSDAERRDYKRRSHWFRLNDNRLYRNLETFIQKQKGFINYCLTHYDHNWKPFDEPKWQKKEEGEYQWHAFKKVGIS